MVTPTYKRDYNGKLLYLPKERNWFERRGWCDPEVEVPKCN